MDLFLFLNAITCTHVVCNFLDHFCCRSLFFFCFLPQDRSSLPGRERHFPFGWIVLSLSVRPLLFVISHSRLVWRRAKSKSYTPICARTPYSVASLFSTENGSLTGREPESAIITSFVGRSRPSVEVFSILRTTSIPSSTLPNTT